MMRSKQAVIIFALSAICLFGSQTPAPPRVRLDPGEPVFQSGTRLVEVEVLVRDKNGPVGDLSRDDFRVFDQGKPQQIAVFSSASGAKQESRPVDRLAPGAVSNRAKPSGEHVAGATVLLLDFLNTSFDNAGYARKNLTKFIQLAPAGEEIAIYMLGMHLSVVQDFTGDGATLANAVRRYNPQNLSLLIQGTENMDSVDREMNDNPIKAQIRHDITTEAIGTIARHLAGMPGRKSLVWLSDQPGGAGSQFLGPANIHLYPVLVRGVGPSGVFAWANASRGMRAGMPMAPIPAGNEIGMRHAMEAMGNAYGAKGFTDSADIGLAVQSAVRDAQNTYILGFYPPSEMLDNKFHALNVEVGKNGLLRGRKLEVRYRPGYFATVLGGSSPIPASVDSILGNPLDATGIGLAALPHFSGGKYQMDITIDLNDLDFHQENNRQVAALTLSVADDSTRQITTETVKLSFTDAQLAVARANGLSVTKTLLSSSAVRIVARDVNTGTSGSLHVIPPSGTPAH